MAGPGLQLRLDVRLAPDADSAELDEAARALRMELLSLDVESVRGLSAGPAPPGTRAIEIAIIGGLMVTAARELIAAVVRTAERWAAQRSVRTVKVTIGGDSIELSGVSDEDQTRLIELFIARTVARPS